MRYWSVLSTCFILERWRIRLRFFLLARWRRPDWDVMILPLAVILKRLATAFLVLRRAMDLGIRLVFNRSKPGAGWSHFQVRNREILPPGRVHPHGRTCAP